MTDLLPGFADAICAPLRQQVFDIQRRMGEKDARNVGVRRRNSYRVHLGVDRPGDCLDDVALEKYIEHLERREAE